MEKKHNGHFFCFRERTWKFTKVKIHKAKRLPGCLNAAHAIQMIPRDETETTEKRA